MKTIDLLFSKPPKPHIVSTEKRTDGRSDYIMPQILFGGIKCQLSISWNCGDYFLQVQITQSAN